MTIEEFKELSLEAKLHALRYDATWLAAYDRVAENGASKTSGDIFQLHDFWVFLSDDEKMVIPSRRSPIKE